MAANLEQMPGSKGGRLWKHAVLGSATWSAMKRNQAIGRLVETSPKLGLARSFSCGSCQVMCNGGKASLSPNIYGLGREWIQIVGSVAGPSIYMA